MSALLDNKEVYIRYGSALFKLAHEQNSLEQTITDIQQILEMLKISPILEKFITSPLYGTKDQQSLLDRLFTKAPVSPLVQNFVNVLIHNHRLNILHQSCSYFLDKVATEKRQIKALLTSAHRLSDEQKSAISKALKGSLSANTVELEERVDPSLIGGLVLQVGTHIIDSSIKTQLKKLIPVMEGNA